jgi:hypothetical protein
MQKILNTMRTACDPRNFSALRGWEAFIGQLCYVFRQNLLQSEDQRTESACKTLGGGRCDQVWRASKTLMSGLSAQVPR